MRSLLALMGVLAAAPAYAEDPPGVDIESFDLAQLLSVDVASGDAGSFGRRLHLGSAAVHLNGFSITEMRVAHDGSPTFEQEFFNLIAGGSVEEVVIVEMQIEARENVRELGIVYAQLDYDVFRNGTLLIRAGKWLVPFGTFNEYLYPEYLNKMAFPPHTHRHMLPRGLALVGAQARGRAWVSSSSNINYAAYVANSPADPDVHEAGEGEETEHTEESEAHPAFLANGTDLSEPARALATGGRIGVHAADAVDIGVSGLVGSWDPELWAPLLAANADLSVAWQGLSVRSEALWIRKVASNGDTTRYGYFVQAAFLLPETGLEPALQLDQLLGFDEAAETVTTFTGGLNFYPLHRKTRKVVVKANLEHEMREEAQQTFILQLGAGF